MGLWRVVGGEQQGLLVRQSCALSSAEGGRLRHGAVVEALQLRSARMRYRRYGSCLVVYLVGYII